MKKKTKEKLWNGINISLPLIMLIIGFGILEDKTILYFLGTIWIVFSLIPIVISSISKWKIKRKDIFVYQYSNPLMTGIIIAAAFLIFNKSQDNIGVIMLILTVFIILYAINHIYISRRYPNYYFKS